jgi:hypothetical protein
MDIMPIAAVIFQSIPEEIVLFAFGLAIIGEEIKFKKIFVAAVMLAFTAYFVRVLPFPFGVHTIICALAMIVIFKLAFNIQFLPGIIATLSSFGALLSAENSVGLPILSAIGVHSFQDVWSNTILRIIIAWPHLLLLGAITYFLYVKKISILKSNTREASYAITTKETHPEKK